MQENIENRLKEIIKSRFKLNFDIVNKEDYDLSFFDPVYGFSAGDMLYLFFDVEKAFNIRIPEEYIEKNEFSSFNSIVNIIGNLVS